jgi:hypothetical protein
VIFRIFGALNAPERSVILAARFFHGFSTDFGAEVCFCTPFGAE